MADEKTSFEGALQKLVDCSRVVGEQFFDVMVEALADALSVRWVFLCLVNPEDPGRVDTVAVWSGGQRGENFHYDLAGTPCARVVGDRACYFPNNIQALFPEDRLLADMGAESYVGAPLRASNGKVLGLLAALHDAPLDLAPRPIEVLEIFAGRAAAELERVSAETTTQRLGQIVEEAASEAYVFDANTFRFTLVNRGARDNLGHDMAELGALTPWDLYPEFTREQFLALVEPLRSGEERRLDFESVHRRKDGSLYDVSVRLQLMRTGTRKVYYAAVQDISGRRRTERALRETTRRLDAILNNTKMAVFMMDHRQHCIYMNEAAEQLTGYRFEETRGRPLHDVIHHTHPDGRPFPLSECVIDRAFPEGHQVEGEEVFIHKDGSFYPVGFTASPMYDDAGRPIGTIIEARNIEQELQTRDAMAEFNAALEKRVEEAIAQRKRVEAQLAQAQKMEAVGKLTGGVAHDFSNLLQVIRGNLELLAKDLRHDPCAERRLRNALVGVSRGAKLASQLLAFGRRQPLEPKTINLGRLVREMDDMLRRALGEGVEVETVIAGGLWNCLADPAQVENAVLNLAINARDAMQGRGKLTVEVGNACLDDDYVRRYSELMPGQYVMLAVSDTGCGIAPELVEQVFEPFFSTKPEGEGSGLGLSMVYGFAKQSGGHVKLYSEVGEGTTVRIYLPRTRQAEEVRAERGPVHAGGGHETILVVEDDAAVRATAAEMLNELGYRVLQAEDADAAWRVVESGAAIDLLFTDVVMPGRLRSPELAQMLQARLPGAGVLFTSGYTQNSIVHAGRLDEGVELLSKPYRREELARKVRQVLDARPPGDKQDAPRPPPADAAAEGQRSLRILVVEDEELIRVSTADLLRNLGHRTAEAGTVAEALAQLERDNFHILLTDLSLPDGSGEDLAAQVARRSPDLRVIFASGRVAEDPDPGVAWLQKPYDQRDLARVIAAAADTLP